MSSNFWHETEPRAAKEHKCEECHGRIPKGEKHHRITGSWEGDMFSVRQCGVCYELFGEVQEIHGSGDDGVAFGSLYEYVFESREGKLEWMRRYTENAELRGAPVPDWMRKKLEEAEAEATIKAPMDPRLPRPPMNCSNCSAEIYVHEEILCDSCGQTCCHKCVCEQPDDKRECPRCSSLLS